MLLLFLKSYHPKHGTKTQEVLLLIKEYEKKKHYFGERSIKYRIQGDGRWRLKLAFKILKIKINWKRTNRKRFPQAEKPEKKLLIFVEFLG